MPSEQASLGRERFYGGVIDAHLDAPFLQPVGILSKYANIERLPLPEGAWFYSSSC
jgi:hypothetical protein